MVKPKRQSLIQFVGGQIDLKASDQDVIEALEAQAWPSSVIWTDLEHM